MKKKKIKVLHLVLRHRWYDMILSYAKPEEYRKACPYWAKRIFGCKSNIDWCQPKGAVCKGCSLLRTLKESDYTHVCFHRGYTSTTILHRIDGIRYGYGNPEWGAPEDEEVFIIRLGERIE